MDKLLNKVLLHGKKKQQLTKIISLRIDADEYELLKKLSDGNIADTLRNLIFTYFKTIYVRQKIRNRERGLK